jgi:hypothetical protein
MTVQTPIEFSKKIAESLSMKVEQVDDLLNIGEDRNGYFVATLYPQKFLDKTQFRMMCALVKDLGGEGYLQGAKSWMVPGPLAKKSPTPIPTETPTQTPTKSPIQISQSSQICVGALPEDEDIQGLRGSSKKVGSLYPVLLNSNGDVIDGFHRLKANPDWPKYTVEGITDPLQLAIARLVANERREVSPEEKTRLLREIHVYTGWNTKRIADELGWSIRKVYLYLPDDIKDPGKAAAGALGGSKSAASLAAPMDKSVSTATLPSQETTLEKPSPEEKPEKEEPKETSDSHFEEEKQGWARPGEAVQIAEFDCPDCHQHLIVEHQPSGKHVIRIVREVE